MAFHTPPRQQQGLYRYDPATLKQQGPSRLFPHAGEDGMLRYILTKLSRDLLDQGKLSQPWSLLLQQVEANLDRLNQAWYFVATQLVDLKVFQSGWFNLDLPPDEQFNASFVQQRKAMIAALQEAKAASEKLTQGKEARSQFYNALERHGRSRPITLQIHQREGGLSDREFARQRVAGQNPMMLRQVQPADQPLLQSWAEQKTMLQDNSINLVQAAAEHRLFLADYPLLENLSPADLQPGRYVGSPIALFYQSSTGLEPCLIQLEPGRVVTPELDGEADAWMQAKLFVQVADVTYHELISHLCHTHLAMEAFAIATPRQLPINHPMYRLLRPHFQFLLAINTRGNEILLGPGAAIDNLMAPTRAASLSLMNKAYREREFQDYALPTNLKQRGVGAEFLPEFPYRDDALLLWEAIAHYVSQYLQQYYTNDAAVHQDAYLQAWAAELGTAINSRPLAEFPQVPTWLPPELAVQAELDLQHRPGYPRIPGFPTELTRLSELIKIATQIIFTCGPQHAAVNFSQFDYVGYTPNAPLSAYCRPESCRSLEQLLPSTQKDLGQIELSFALSGIRWGTLGSSELMAFRDTGDRQILAQFQADLVQIEAKIGDRNRQRLADSGVAYPYLLPSRIPNSINI